ncbi:alpha-crystallin B chain [Diabrotica virgifera virgifera]|uniref:Alpha-crystallin B chain-like n=1 Tax=Diabrotica virgifera virgifera TaxID=50390 RepID=A0A6P7F9Y3_DIAVI|nr:alpha-crystallin B chain [Diabrotica virgifera virgifera]
MSLIPFDNWNPKPFLFDPNWDREFFMPLMLPPRNLMSFPENFGNFSTDLSDDVFYDKNRFQVNVYVQHFKPDEIQVKFADNTVTVEAEHEEKQDEHGQIYRHFVRKYTIPESYDVKQLQSKLSSDGVLTISAPKAGDELEYRTIPVIQTNKPVKQLKQKKEKKMPIEKSKM